jgi:hypothetical protein
MVADVDVANRVLQAIGTRSNIASLTEGSPESDAVQREYASSRDELLRKFDWNWAERQIPAALLRAMAGTPENPTGASLPLPALPWRYAYAYPADCIKMRGLMQGQPVATLAGIPISLAGGTAPRRLVSLRDWREAGDLDPAGNPRKVILSNVSQVVFVYTGTINDPNIWDSLFVAALVGRLAAKLVTPRAGDKALANMAIRSGKEAETDAEAVNGNEGITVMDSTPDWISASGYRDYDHADDY